MSSCLTQSALARFEMRTGRDFAVLASYWCIFMLHYNCFLKLILRLCLSDFCTNVHTSKLRCDLCWFDFHWTYLIAFCCTTVQCRCAMSVNRDSQYLCSLTTSSASFVKGQQQHGITVLTYTGGWAFSKEIHTEVFKKIYKPFRTALSMNESNAFELE